MKEESDLNLAAASENGSADRDRLLNLLLAADRKRRASHAIAPRSNRDAPIPLSYAQERLWFLDQVGLAGAAYNVLLALRLTGDLVEGALERSFAQLARRHETLRTHFELHDGIPHQVIDPPSVFSLHHVDLSRAADADLREQQLRELIQHERTLQFDLHAGPIARAVLARLGIDEHTLIVTIHHIACDGWSLGILIRELSALYSADVRGDVSALAELPVQYADYAVWQRQWLQGSVWREQMQYWKQRLLNVPQQLDLPTDQPRPAIESFRGGELRFTLPASLCATLKELAVREGATLFMVVLGAYQILLSRWSGQHDVVVGSPIAARRHREIEGLIGFFVNTLALRLEVDAGLTFRHLLERVKEATLGAYAHQDLPFEALVKELRPERNLSRQPIFQVMLALQNFPDEQLQLPGLNWSWREAERTTTHFDLTLYLAQDASGGLSGLFEYASDLFDPVTIERLTRHFATLLQGIVADADAPVGRLPLLTEAEKRQLLLQSAGTTVDYREQVLVHELFEEQVAAYAARSRGDIPGPIDQLCAAQQQGQPAGAISARAGNHAQRSRGHLRWAQS